MPLQSKETVGQANIKMEGRGVFFLLCPKNGPVSRKAGFQNGLLPLGHEHEAEWRPKP